MVTWGTGSNSTFSFDSNPPAFGFGFNPPPQQQPPQAPFGMPTAAPSGGGFASEPITFGFDSSSSPCDKQHTEDLGRDVWDFVSNQEEDVTFVVQGEEIPAHKTIMAARSEYFRTMLYGDMKESTSDRIPIESGVTPSIFRQIIKFIYSGGVEDNMNAAEIMEMLPYADFYQINGLKNLCQVKISSSLSPQTALDILRVGRQTNSIELQTCALKYILSHAKDPVLMACVKTFSMNGDPDGPEMIKEVLLYLMQHGEISFSFGSSPFGSSAFGSTT